jgi:hypothetical protein
MNTQELEYQELPDGTVRVARKSPMSGQVNHMDLPMTVQQLTEFCHDGGATLIQRLLPQLNADQREFLKTGYTPEDWELVFPPVHVPPQEVHNG